MTTTLRVFGRWRAVIAMILWPRIFSVTVIRNASLQVAPAAPVQDTRTIAEVPLTLALPTDVWPPTEAAATSPSSALIGADDGVPKSLRRTAR